MSTITLDDLTTRIRECQKELQLVSESLPNALRPRPPSQGESDIVLRIAEEDIMQLRTTVDAITRQFLYRTWSYDFKARVDESMKHTTWPFPHF
jgi:hypothetical protein